MSYTVLTYHIVLGTRRREHTIDPAHEKELYNFIYRMSQKRDVLVRRIGGMPDHIHILCDIPAKMALAEYVKFIKTESSKFLRVNPNFSLWDGWAEGYGAFTVDSSMREMRRQYIMRQKEHHAKAGFAEELRTLLAEAGLSVD